MGDPCGTQKIKSTWAEARYVSASGWHGDRVEMVGLGGLGLKIEGCAPCGRMALMEGMWHYRKACVEVKQSHEGGLSVRGPVKKLGWFYPLEVFGLCASCMGALVVCRVSIYLWMSCWAAISFVGDPLICFVERFLGLRGREE